MYSFYLNKVTKTTKQVSQASITHIRYETSVNIKTIVSLEKEAI